MLLLTRVKLGTATENKEPVSPVLTMIPLLVPRLWRRKSSELNTEGTKAGLKEGGGRSTAEPCLSDPIGTRAKSDNKKFR